MLFFRQEYDGTVSIGKEYDPWDEDLIDVRNKHGDWRNVVKAILMEPLADPHEFNSKLVTCFTLWGLEEFEGRNDNGSPKRSGILTR